jgi:hypothetical protein
MSKKSEGFVFVAIYGRFKAMVKYSAKTRLPAGVFDRLAHSIRKIYYI